MHPSHTLSIRAFASSTVMNLPDSPPSSDSFSFETASDAAVAAHVLRIDAPDDAGM